MEPSVTAIHVDCGAGTCGPVGAILEWADRRQIEVLGIDSEVGRLACTATAVSAEELFLNVA